MLLKWQEAKGIKFMVYVNMLTNMLTISVSVFYLISYVCVLNIGI